MYVLWYVRLIESRYKILFLRITYVRHMAKIVSPLSAEYAIFELGSYGVQKIKHQDKSITQFSQERLTTAPRIVEFV